MSKKRLIMAIVVLFTCFTTSWCQDTLRVERIEFEFDENGAFMDEFPVFEEVDSMVDSDFERESDVNRRLTIESGTSTDIASVTLEAGLKAKDCSMTIFSLSGIKVYALPYAADPRRLYKIGVNFSSDRRCIEEWKVVER